MGYQLILSKKSFQKQRGGNLMMDEEKIKPMIIADRPIKEYFWAMGLELSRPYTQEIAMWATDNNMGTVDRLIRLWDHFLVEEVKGSRKRKQTINIKSQRKIIVNEVILRKSPLLEK